MNLEHAAAAVAGREIVSVFFGGGTPSMLNEHDLGRIFETLHLHYSIADKPEITLEANPDDLTPSYLTALALTPVNR